MTCFRKKRIIRKKCNIFLSIFVKLHVGSAAIVKEVSGKTEFVHYLITVCVCVRYECRLSVYPYALFSNSTKCRAFISVLAIPVTEYSNI